MSMHDPASNGKILTKPWYDKTENANFNFYLKNSDNG